MSDDENINNNSVMDTNDVSDSNENSVSFRCCQAKMCYNFFPCTIQLFYATIECSMCANRVHGV